MCEAETGTSRVAGVNPYLTPETLDGELADGEAQSAALRLFVELLEALEYLLLLLQRDAAAGVLDAEERLTGGGEAEREVDVALGGELGGVDEQVDEQLLQAGLVGMEGERGEFGTEAYLGCGLLDALHRVDDVVADGHHLLIGVLELHVAQLDVGEIDDVAKKLL